MLFSDVAAVERALLQTIECLTLGLSAGMNEVTINYCYAVDYPLRG